MSVPSAGRTSAAHPHKSLIERLTAFIFREPENREQLLELLSDAHERDLLDADALSMIEGVLQVSELRARDLMVPRAQMDVIDIDEPIDQWAVLHLHDTVGRIETHGHPIVTAGFHLHGEYFHLQHAAAIGRDIGDGEGEILADGGVRPDHLRRVLAGHLRTGRRFRAIKVPFAGLPHGLHGDGRVAALARDGSLVGSVAGANDQRQQDGQPEFCIHGLQLHDNSIASDAACAGSVTSFKW